MSGRNMEIRTHLSFRQGVYTGVLVYVLFLMLYGYTLCPGIGSGDSPEFITAGSTYGIPHPPGYPLYTFLSNALSLNFPMVL